MTLSIDTMYAYISVDEQGEGIMAFSHPDLGWMPMVGADMERMESMRGIAQAMVTETGVKAVLTKFDAREDLEILTP